MRSGLKSGMRDGVDCTEQLGIVGDAEGRRNTNSEFAQERVCLP